MNWFFKEKVFSPFACLIMAIVVGLVAIFITIPIAQNGIKDSLKLEQSVKKVLKQEELFDNAIQNSMTAKDVDIRNLVTLTKDNKDVLFKDDRVLLVTRKSISQSLDNGKEITTDHPVWCYSQKELENWYDNNKQAKQVNWSLRLTQLLGENISDVDEDYIGFWVKPEDVYRPAYYTNPLENKMYSKLSSDATEEEKKFFEEKIYLAYYGDVSYPWTRLGYTYDWAYNEKTYGLSEFNIKSGSTIILAFDYSTEEYLDYLNNK